MHLEFTIRIELTLEEELLMNRSGELPERLDGYTPEHPEPGGVRDFLMRNGFPWSQRYVSVFVGIEGVSENEDSKLGCFGRAFRLKCDEILPAAELACSRDIQDVALNDLSPLLLVDLRNYTSPAEVQRKLVKIAADALDNSPSHYGEVRLNRPLRSRDIVWPE
jgi:hypothetical protein